MEENSRRHEFTITDLESVESGYANGISTFLANSEKGSLTAEHKKNIIRHAASKFGEFLSALGVDWENDPNSKETPMRVAKAYVYDLWSGRYDNPPKISSFPSDNYKDGMVIERNIELVSMCSHHHQTISGVVHVGYVAGERVIGLSKLNRIVEYFGRRGAIQEELTAAIHFAVDKVCEGNKGVIVTIHAKHNCVACRGVRHSRASMVTTKATGVFMDNNGARIEFFESVKLGNGS